MTSNSAAAPAGDPWIWRAEFADGSQLDEVDADRPDGRSWADLQVTLAERDTTLARLVLIPQRPHLAAHAIFPCAGAQFVLARRRYIIVSPTTGEEVARREPITILMTTWLDVGKTAYTFLFADSSVVVSDDLNAV